MGFGGAADYLTPSSRTGQKVLLEPIGIVGYHGPLVVIDEIGLVSPQIAERRLQGPGWYSDVVTSEKPDWLVVRARHAGERRRAFAGAGAPFRSVRERVALLGPTRPYAIEPTRADRRRLRRRR